MLICHRFFSAMLIEGFFVSDSSELHITKISSARLIVTKKKKREQKLTKKIHLEYCEYDVYLERNTFYYYFKLK